MDARLIFGLSALMSMVSGSILAALYVWPWLRARARDQALATLVAPHMLIRFLGLSFLISGVVSPAVPAAFAVPAAYGDFVAGVLAIAATIALAKHAPGAVAAVWVFNILGLVDLLYAFYAGGHAQLQPGSLGAAFYLPTAMVPLLLISHFLIFGLLLRREQT
jgi:hypothetical protein